MSYAAFLERKRQLGGDHGFSPDSLPDHLFDFQRALVEWSLRKGRGAMMADCGLGKSPMELAWAESVALHADKPVLIAAPLAVSHQFVREAEKFNVGVTRSQDGSPGTERIAVTNYERLDRFDPADFAGLVCDESSAIKSFDSQRRSVVTNFARKLPYRLLATATGAPNDYTELGTSSEALGEMGYMDMLSRFFTNSLGNSTGRGRAYGGVVKWRFKGHAEPEFWRWVCSWARAMRRPSDLGYDDGRFVLPPLLEREHIVDATEPDPERLFDMPSRNFFEERAERRRTISDRCAKVAELVAHDDQALVWCHLNDEGDLLAKLIPDAEQVKGSDSDDDKEAKLLAFAEGDLRCLITKPKIGAWGLNFQRCAHITDFPSHSYESRYQGIRRCWRFGQERPVVVDTVATEGEAGITANLKRKGEQADRMFDALVIAMNDALAIRPASHPTTKAQVPAWL